MTTSATMTAQLTLPTLEYVTGVWVTWDYGDGSPTIRTANATELDALRIAVKRSGMGESVTFVQYGETLNDALTREQVESARQA